MLRWSIQRIKAMLLYIVYGILFVDTVDMKIKACNALNAMFVETVDTGVYQHPATADPSLIDYSLPITTTYLNHLRAKGEPTHPDMLVITCFFLFCIIPNEGMILRSAQWIQRRRL